jgi:hypothetical protein
MTPADMESPIKNLDHRVMRTEQILPTLATKDDLREAVRHLATKEELREAVRHLATKDELREGLADLRRHMHVLYEDLKGDILLLAEHLAHVAQRLDER